MSRWSLNAAAVMVQAGQEPPMRREALYPFLPAVLAALTNAVTAAMVRSSQTEYPGRFVVYQVVMFGAALLAAVPNKWVRIVGLVLLLAGVLISMAVGLLYLPTFFAFVWVMTRDGPAPVRSGQGRPAK
jgi:hypothetical protein